MHRARSNLFLFPICVFAFSNWIRFLSSLLCPNSLCWMCWAALWRRRRGWSRKKRSAGSKRRRGSKRWILYLFLFDAELPCCVVLLIVVMVLNCGCIGQFVDLNWDDTIAIVPRIFIGIVSFFISIFLCGFGVYASTVGIRMTSNFHFAPWLRWRILSLCAMKLH